MLRLRKAEIKKSNPNNFALSQFLFIITIAIIVMHFLHAPWFCSSETLRLFVTCWICRSHRHRHWINYVELKVFTCDLTMRLTCRVCLYVRLVVEVEEQQQDWKGIEQKTPGNPASKFTAPVDRLYTMHHQSNKLCLWHEDQVKVHNTTCSHR
mgnify:CR=1 FL=1